jgi:capsular polysaccharide biosynthesis protein
VVKNAEVHGDYFATFKGCFIKQTEDDLELPTAHTNYGVYFKKIGPFYLLDESHLTSVIKLERALLIAHRFSFNYFHWMFDSLPRLLRSDEPEDIPAIISSRMPKQHFELLKLVSSRPTVAMSFHDRATVDYLVIPPSRCCLPDIASPPPTVSADSVRLMVNKLRQPSKPDCGILFVDRSDHARKTGGRDIVNVDELKALVSNQGGAIFDPLTASIEQQRDVFSSARIILMQAGAAFSNVVFCNPETTILCISQPHGTDLGFFSDIAKAAGVRYATIYGACADTKVSSHCNIRVEIDAVKRALAWARRELVEPDGFTVQN